VGGSDRAAFTATLCWEVRNVRVVAAHGRRIKEKGKSSLTDRPSGSITNDQRSSLLFLTALRLIAHLALVTLYSRGMVLYQPRARQRHMVGRLVHLEDAEPPLYEGDDPPVVKVRENRGRAQPGVYQALQHEQG
jgi:hypothetical protein